MAARPNKTKSEGSQKDTSDKVTKIKETFGAKQAMRSGPRDPQRPK